MKYCLPGHNCKTYPAPDDFRRAFRRSVTVLAGSGSTQLPPARGDGSGALKKRVKQMMDVIHDSNFMPYAQYRILQKMPPIYIHIEGIREALKVRIGRVLKECGWFWLSGKNVLTSHAPDLGQL